MRASDQVVLASLSQSLSAGRRPWMCTIVGTQGSSPRPIGSLVAVDESGHQTGSISGGCVEEALIERLLNGEFDRRIPTQIQFGVTAEENEKLGLPCGGRLLILVQRLEQQDRVWIDALLTGLEQRRITERQLDLRSGDTDLAPSSTFMALALGDSSLRHCFGPRTRLLLVGAGQLAASIASLALAMDYEVVLTDSRDWALNQWQGPDVEKVLGLPDDVVRARANDRHSAVMTLSHDPRVDDMALMEALESDAWYVGALGSVRTTKARLERLRILGLTEDALARLHAPIGLSIGSKTPMEIAVSVMAQLTQLRRRASESGTSAQ